MVRVGINGFGRIGRLIVRAGIDDPDVEFVAINDLTDTHTLAHLFKYDSVHGRFKGEVSNTDDSIVINGKPIRVHSERDPAAIPWGVEGVEVVAECTGHFRDRQGAAKHLEAGAKKVIISAPGKDVDITIVKGVNEHDYDKERHHVISNASCTTNCIAPVIKVLDDNYGIEKGFLTTVHADTNDQHVLDLPHKDLRRARAAGRSIIPTTTGAARAVAQVLPHLKGKLDGMALRVPVLDGSISDLTLLIGKDVTADELNKLFSSVADNELKGVLAYTDEPIVSVDIIDNPHSSIVDGLSTQTNGNLVKVIAWYDNEWGYSNRMLDMLKMVW
ncbi:MAG: type I glyceraldehyde-3-phosphate dehydrogenase [archaeon]